MHQVRGAGAVRAAQALDHATGCLVLAEPPGPVALEALRPGASKTSTTRITSRTWSTCQCLRLDRDRCRLTRAASPPGPRALPTYTYQPGAKSTAPRAPTWMVVARASRSTSA